MVIETLDKETFASDRQQSEKYLFLCFFESTTPPDSEFLGAIEGLTEKIGSVLEVYLGKEADLDFFQNTFDFWGTPTYILLRGGQEIGRLLGKVSSESITQFIVENVSNITST